MINFLSGAAAMGFAIAALFFLRFWARTKDSLFLIFSLSFGLLAANHAISALYDVAVEHRSWIYLLRLAAFLLIIVAITFKNFNSDGR